LEQKPAPDELEQKAAPDKLEQKAAPDVLEQKKLEQKAVPDGSFVIRPAALARGCSLQAALVPFFTVGARPNLPAARKVAVDATMICTYNNKTRVAYVLQEMPPSPAPQGQSLLCCIIACWSGAVARSSAQAHAPAQARLRDNHVPEFCTAHAL
jgi:hypothetical protein